MTLFPYTTLFRSFSDWTMLCRTYVGNSVLFWLRIRMWLRSWLLQAGQRFDISYMFCILFMFLLLCFSLWYLRKVISLLFIAFIVGCGLCSLIVGCGHITFIYCIQLSFYVAWRHTRAMWYLIYILGCIFLAAIFLLLIFYFPLCIRLFVLYVIAICNQHPLSVSISVYHTYSDSPLILLHWPWY